MNHLRTVTCATVLSIAAATTLAQFATAAPGQPEGPLAVALDETFDAGVPDTWRSINLSDPAGPQTGWFTGNPAVLRAHEGAGGAYVASNVFSTETGGTLSTWLITPLIEDLSAGDQVRFFTRVAELVHPDRLEVRASSNGACEPGASATDVGDFTTLLTTINPGLAQGTYPNVWTETEVALPAMAPGSGCVALRHHVPDSGEQGALGDYVAVDTFTYSHWSDPTVPDTTLTPRAEPFAYDFATAPAYLTGTYECSLDGAAYGPCTSPLTLTNLSDGTHSLAVRAVSAAGVVDTTPAETTITVGTSPTTPPPTSPTHTSPAPTAPVPTTPIPTTAPTPGTSQPTSRIVVKSPKKVRAGKKFRVSITGLAPGATVTLKWKGKKVSRAASAAGTVTVTFKAPRVTRTKKVRLKVTGALRSTRVVKVLPRRR